MMKNVAILFIWALKSWKEETCLQVRNPNSSKLREIRNGQGADVECLLKV